MVNAAIGGSTNAVLHLLALAGRLGVPLELADFEVHAKDVPLLVDLMPSGRHQMEDFYYAGGLPAVLRRAAGPARPDLHHHHRSAARRRRSPAVACCDREVIRPQADPVAREQGTAVLRRQPGPGRRHPQAVRGEPPTCCCTAGAPWSSTRMQDYSARIDDETCTIDADSVLVLRGVGPLGYPGMPEVGNVSLPRRLLEAGVTDLVRISDGRMSGTGFGTVVLHVAPEAAAGGPLALVRDGDWISLDVPARRLTLEVPDDELAARRLAWRRRRGARPRLRPALRPARPAGRPGSRLRLPRRRLRLVRTREVDMSGTTTTWAEPASPPSDPPRTALSRAGGVLRLEHSALVAALLAMVAFFAYSRPDVFLTTSNVVNIGNAAALLCIIAIGQALVIIGGGFDLSVGAMVGLGSVSIAALLQATGAPGIVGVALALGLGLLVGVLNGLIVTRGLVNPLIATLGTLSAFQGIAFLIADGQSITVIDPLFSELGSGRLLSLPYGLWMAVLLAAAAAFVLRFTDIGRNIYAVGGNPVAAMLAGIHVQRYTVGLYAFAGFAAGIGAVLLTARTGSGLPVSGSAGLELSSITAAVLGGCALNGGRGGIAGTVLGVLVLGTLDNGLILMGVPTFWQLVAKGCLLIVAVMVQQRRTPAGERRPA